MQIFVIGPVKEVRKAEAILRGRMIDYWRKWGSFVICLIAPTKNTKTLFKLVNSMVQYGPESVVPSSIKVISLTSVNTGTYHSISRKELIVWWNKKTISGVVYWLMRGSLSDWPLRLILITLRLKMRVWNPTVLNFGRVTFKPQLVCKPVLFPFVLVKLIVEF